MLMTREQADAVVGITGCDLVKVTNIYHGYNGDMYDVTPYNGRLGSGWAVTKRKCCEIYVSKNNYVYDKVFDGGYDIDFSNCNFPTFVKVAGVEIKPVYEIQLDTVFGDVLIRQTDSYRPPVLVKNLLIICATDTNVKDIRARIRRKLKSDIKNGKAKLIDEATAYAETHNGGIERVVGV